MSAFASVSFRSRMTRFARRPPKPVSTLGKGAPGGLQTIRPHLRAITAIAKLSIRLPVADASSCERPFGAGPQPRRQYRASRLRRLAISRRGRRCRRQTHASTLQATSANAAPTGPPPPRCPHMSASRAAPAPRNEQNALRTSTAGCCACAMMRPGLAAACVPRDAAPGTRRPYPTRHHLRCFVETSVGMHPCGCLSGEDSERRFLWRCRRNQLLGDA